MNKSAKNILTVSVSATALITVLSAIFSYIAMTDYFDSDIGHFSRNSVIPALGMYLPFVVSAVSIVCAILIRKKAVFKDKPQANIPVIFSSVLTGLLIAAASVLGTSSTPDVITGISYQLPTSSALSKAVTVAGIITALYFILYPFIKNKAYMILLSFAPPIWAALRLLEEYFETGAPINSPLRTSSLSMFAFILLFLAEEIRFAIDRESVGVYYFCTLNAIAFTGNAVFPRLAVIMAGKNTFDFSFLECAVGIALFLFLLSRLLATPHTIGDSETIAETQASKNTDDGDSQIENSETL